MYCPRETYNLISKTCCCLGGRRWVLISKEKKKSKSSNPLPYFQAKSSYPFRYIFHTVHRMKREKVIPSVTSLLLWQFLYQRHWTANLHCWGNILNSFSPNTTGASKIFFFTTFVPETMFTRAWITALRLGNHLPEVCLLDMVVQLICQKIAAFGRALSCCETSIWYSFTKFWCHI